MRRPPYWSVFPFSRDAESSERSVRASRSLRAAILLLSFLPFFPTQERSRIHNQSGVGYWKDAGDPPSLGVAEIKNLRQALQLGFEFFIHDDSFHGSVSLKRM